MNNQNNVCCRKYLTEMASLAGLHAHISQDGNRAVWSYRTQPLALVTIKPVELSKEDKEFLRDAVQKLGKAFKNLGGDNRELLSSIILPRKTFDLDIELFAGVPEDVKKKIIQNIERAEQRILQKKNFSKNTEAPLNNERKRLRWRKKEEGPVAGFSASPLVQEYLVAS